MAFCRECQRLLTSDETALYRKLVRRDADSFLCKTCLAGYFQVSETILDKKIEQFRRNGCLLFSTTEGKEEKG